MSQLAISVVGIALTVAAAWALGFRRNPVIADAAEAERIAADALPGFRPVACEVEPGGRAARLTGADGRSVRIAAVGDRWSVA